MESGAHIKGIIMVVQITTTRLRKHGLYRMGLYETVCFMMVNSHTYIFDINKGHAQVLSKDLNTKSYMAEACSECP